MKTQGEMFESDGAPFVVLGVDPGEVDGWGIMRPDKSIKAHGETKKRDAHGRKRAVLLAVGEALSLGVDLIVSREMWSAGGPKATPTMIAGLGAQWGRWLEQLDLWAPFLPPTRIVKFYPQSWRAKLGVGSGDVVKNMRAYVGARWPGINSSELGEDELMGIGLAVCARRDKDTCAIAQRKPGWHRAAREMGGFI